jgi:PAS domain S-box-containing protein
MSLHRVILVFGVVAALAIAAVTAVTLWTGTDDEVGIALSVAWAAGALGGLAAVGVLAFALAIQRRLLSDTRLRADVREGADRLDAIVQSAMSGIVAIDADQRVVLFNAEAERMFGCPAAQAIGAPLDRFLPERFRAAHRAHVEEFGRTGVTSRRMGQLTALSALRADGTEFPIEASISQATAGGQKIYTVILRDVTERVRFETALLHSRQQTRESEARLDVIVRSAMDAIITVDADQRIVLFNAAAEQLLGCSAADALGGPLDRFVPERFRAAHRRHIEQFGRTGETARRMGPQITLAALRADGTEVPIEASISQASLEDHRLFTVILRDISARVRIEAELRRAREQERELAVAMLEVREAERTRIARELHDELGQALTGLKMDLEVLARLAPAERTDIAARAVAMRELLDGTVETTRRISSDLRPLVLDDLGLGAAAEWLVESVAERTGLACALVVDPACARVGEPHASALFRIMQESLTNVVRHARAGRVEVRLERAGGVAVLTVSDDGVGMGTDSQAKPRSFGLRGMSERALLLGGGVSISSGPGAGTRLVARIPLGGPGARPS